MHRVFLLRVWLDFSQVPAVSEYILHMHLLQDLGYPYLNPLHYFHPRILF